MTLAQGANVEESKRLVTLEEFQTGNLAYGVLVDGESACDLIQQKSDSGQRVLPPTISLVSSLPLMIRQNMQDIVN